MAGGAAGERDDARGLTQVFEPSGDLLLLKPEPLGREDRIALFVGSHAQRFHELRELGVPLPALRTIGQVFRNGRIECFAPADGEVAVEQALLLEVTGAEDHGLPPSRPRSLRAARNR